MTPLSAYSFLKSLCRDYVFVFGKSVGTLRNHEWGHSNFPCGSVRLNWEMTCRCLLEKEERSALRMTSESSVSKQGRGNGLFSGLIWQKNSFMPKGFLALGKICLLCFAFLIYSVRQGLVWSPISGKWTTWSHKIFFFSFIRFLLWIPYLGFYSKSTYLQIEKKALPVFSFLIFTW